MGHIAWIRGKGYTDLPQEDLEMPSGFRVRFCFLEDEGDLVRDSSSGLDGWSEPSLIVRFAIHLRENAPVYLDCRFSRGEWFDVQQTPDDVLSDRLRQSLPLLEIELLRLQEPPRTSL